MGKAGAVTVDGRAEREGEGYCCGGWIGGWMVVCWLEGKASEGERKRENGEGLQLLREGWRL